MPIFIDLTGRTYNKLTIISLHSKKPAKWNCICECGNKTIAEGKHVKSGHTKSCGCAHKTHGMGETPIYSCWTSIRYRCNNPKSHAYKDYGGRGIKLCRSWQDSFLNFYSDMGDKPTPSHTIERVDNNGDYSPDNCIWATRGEQSNNTRSNSIVIYHGVSLTISQWARNRGFKPKTLAERLRQGWSIERALNEPINK